MTTQPSQWLDSRRCATCGTTDDVASSDLCRPCLEEHVIAERAAQGLPETITDPAVLSRVAAILLVVDHQDIRCR